ncbi:uncharacterized protein LOC110619454 isoform X2 [Manihot esculenta]|uniref:DUF2470 domain-containing protein n=1 Tax=Manihot esculenta TaxID=3983 RepID=A0A2C9VM45_MANES|nr:uncharacterized protein LOC110619454 isoform X2 [Manihot esculenta]OAY46080.1 hypothetical protein MANES_07G114900v8 [Manihot esculenta]
MKGSKATVLTLAEKCKNILASNWQARLNTIKADAKGSKEDLHTSKVKYILKKGRPYIWIPEKDVHNVNTIIDERGSLAVACPFPGPLANLLRSIKKLPERIALLGDVCPLKDGMAQLAMGSIKEVIQSEQRAMNESTYTVSSVLNSSNLITTSRSESLKELLDGGGKYRVYRFNIRSCMFVDGYGRTHEVESEDFERSKVDPLASFSAKLIDGINRSEARRRALILFCLIYLNANARDAFMVSVDRKGFDVLGKVLSAVIKDGQGEYLWKEFRFTFKEEAPDVETFCHQLVQMEEEAVKKVSSYSGLT